MQEPLQPEEMDAFFDARANGYDAHMQTSLVDATAYYQKLAEPIPDTLERIDILDIGCGTGLEIPAVLDTAPNARLTCIDLSGEMLKILKEKFPEENIGTIEGSYLTYDFGEARYEVILSSMTLHHLLPGQKRTLYGKLMTTLKSGGVYIEGDYIVSEAKMNRLLEHYRALPEEAKGGSHHIDIPLSLDLQTDLLIQAGFHEIRKVYARGENVILAAHRKN